MQCPKCSATVKQNKIGTTSAGSQRYRCFVCQCKYTTEKKRRGYDSAIFGVSRYLGHSSPQVTLGIYAHLVPGGFDEIVNAMSALPSVSEADAVTLE
jgi:hypothetical protein